MGICRKFPGAGSINHYGSNECFVEVSLMLALKCSLFKREYGLINALKALVSIVFMCSLHVIFLSNITPRYFT
jgi:hypothetical protein